MTALLKSKITVPEIPHKALYSQRIKNLDIAGNRIVVITAPSGFGKTTSVLLSLKNEKSRMGWYRLEAEDTLLPVFYAHLIEILFPADDKNTLECYRTLNSVQNIDHEYSLLNAQICQDLLEAAGKKKQRAEERFFLVFDDFHSVLDNLAIVKTIQYFAVNLPSNVSIIVTSRVETGLLSGKLAITPGAKAISAEDLRFTKEDSEKLIKTYYKLDFTEDEFEKIYSFSEGWVAGLYMICHSKHPLSAFSDDPSHLHQSANEHFDRFFQGFLRELGEERRAQLAKISILSDFSESELSEIFHMEQPEALIEWLEKSNLYIQKVLVRPARYRFHSLFRGQLLNALNDSLSDQQIKSLYDAAAAYYQNKGYVEKAIRILIHSGSTREAVAIAQEACIEAFNDGRIDRLTGMINQFPDSIVRGNPYLLFSKGVVLVNIDHKQCYECARDSLTMFKRNKDMSYCMNAFALVMAVAFETCDFSYLESVTKDLPMLRIAMAGGLPFKKLILFLILGVVAEEKLKLGSLLYRWFGKTKIPDPVWSYCFLSIHILLLYRTGRLAESANKLNLVLQHPVGLANDQLRITGIAGYFLCACLSRDKSKIKELMAEMSALGEKYSSDFARGHAFHMSAFMHFQNRNVGEALVSLEKASDAFSRSNSPHLGSICIITRYLWDEDLSSAEERLKKAEAELNNIFQYHIGHGYYELCQGMTGAIAKQAGDYVRAEKLLLQAYAVSHKKGARQSACGMLLQLADLYRLMQDHEREMIYLNRWVKQSRSSDYSFFWEMDYFTFVSVCARAIEKQVDTPYIEKLIRLYFGKERTERFLKDCSNIASDPKCFLLGDRRAGKDPRNVHVQLLGSFKMTIGGREILEMEFKTRKISGILKYILVNTGKPVSREALTLLFWPESDSKAAFASLRVALYELRKILARLDLGFESENALMTESKAGFEVASGNDIRMDIQILDELYLRYKKEAMNPDEKAEILWRMHDLYKGDFLEDNLYDDWVSFTRDRYRSIFVEISHALTLLLIRKGLLHEAEGVLNRLMTIDPLDEKACGLPIHVYKSTDQAMRAHSLKRQFKKRFMQEMGQEADVEIFLPSGDSETK